MTKLEDRLRRDLPALADLLMGDEAAQPGETGSTMADGPDIVLAMRSGAQPAPRRRRWTAVAAAAVVVAAAGVVALVLATSDGTEVTTTEVPIAHPETATDDGASDPETPEPPDGVPETASDQIEGPSEEPGTPGDQTGVGSGQRQDPAERLDGDPAPLAGDPLEEEPSDVGVVTEDRVLDGTFRAISAALGHTCAITSEGEIVCWLQEFVQRGVDDPVAATRDLGHRAGIAAAPEGTYTAIAAGYHHSCARAIDGAITCWGYEIMGFFSEEDVPAGTFKSLSSGVGHSCAIAVDDTIACWGDNIDGQADAPEGSYQAVAAGGYHSCALAADGTIACWGSKSSGLDEVPSGTYKALAAGPEHNCALAADGTIACWGWNGFGQADAPEGTYQAVSAGAEHSCAIATGGNIVCWGRNAGQLDAPTGSYQAITGSGYHNCALAVDGTITCWGNNYLVPIGAVKAGRANWTSGYFQAALYKRLLEELGYRVSDPAELEFGPSNAYTTMAQGDMDYWPNSWYPTHSEWLAQQLPDGSIVADRVTAVGGQLISGGAQGYLVTKSFADAYGVYTLDDLNHNAEALAAYDATDPVPGNGKAEIYGCAPHWTCEDIINNQIAFSGWDNIVQVAGDYDAHFAVALENVDNDVPVVFYTWTPSRYITLLRPGENVYWMGVDDILDDSNPTGVQHGHQHDQRGPDGTGGFAVFGPDECPSAAEQPDGRCPIGWTAADILVTANNDFLAANPVARALLEAVELTVLEVSQAHATASAEGIDPDTLAAQWIADNRDRVDVWLAAARAAG